MFFLGLLSTPLPYLLLAAFYFFGFAMGMFNNSTGDEVVEATSAITIPVEAKQKTVDHTTFYYQINTDQSHSQASILSPEDNTLSYFSDTGTVIFQLRNTKVHEFLHSGFQFSRPPPAVC